MAKPTFGVALLWDATSSPGTVNQLIEGLDTHFPPSKVSNIAVTLSKAAACLHFSADFSLYVKKTLVQVGSEVEKSGGRFIELLRLPEDKREAFNAQFLVPTNGARSTFAHLRDCGPYVQEHVRKLSKGIEEPSVQPTTQAAAPQSSQRPKRRTPRYKSNLEVEIKTDKGFIRERALNISIGGMFVCTSQRPPLKSELGLKVRLPNGRLVPTTARVVHIMEEPSPGGLGLELSQNDRDFMSLWEPFFSPREKK